MRVHLPMCPGALLAHRTFSHSVHLQVQPIFVLALADLALALMWVSGAVVWFRLESPNREWCLAIFLITVVSIYLPHPPSISIPSPPPFTLHLLPPPFSPSLYPHPLSSPSTLLLLLLPPSSLTIPKRRLESQRWIGRGGKKGGGEREGECGEIMWVPFVVLLFQECSKGFNIPRAKN